MSIFSDLAALRLGMHVSQLQRLLEPGAQPCPDGWIRTMWMNTRFDTDGHIALIHFSDDFPSNIHIEGLHIGMTLDRLSNDPRRFRPALRKYPFTLTPYVAITPAGETITVSVGPQGYVRQIEFARPNASLPAVDNAAGPIRQLSLRPYSDNAELLADWAGSATFRDTYPVRMAVAHWLQNESTPEEWHGYVMRHNWDEGLAPLFWIIRQPNCEPATALLAFYMSRPGQNLDYAFDASRVPGWAKEDHDLILEIRDRFLAGAYSGATIAFDANLALAEEAYLPPEPNQAAFAELIPPPMRCNIPGRLIAVETVSANKPRPDLFRRPVSTLRPPPMTEEEQRHIARIQADVAARRHRRSR